MKNGTNAKFQIGSRRIEALRMKDPYFDALCETYQDLDKQIATRGAGPSTSLETERLKRQRAGCLDTILFMLDDAAPDHRNAA